MIILLIIYTYLIGVFGAYTMIKFNNLYSTNTQIAPINSILSWYTMIKLFNKTL